jgi:hypothetical protein
VFAEESLSAINLFPVLFVKGVVARENKQPHVELLKYKNNETNDDYNDGRPAD